MDCTLEEKTRRMLFEAKLGKGHLGETINTTKYLKNRSSTKAVRFETPEKAWLRTF